MHPNEQLIHQFYQAFQNRNAAQMRQCYSEQVIFNDAAFRDLNYEQTAKMWEMLIKRGKDLELDYQVLEANDTSGKAQWTARYTFSQTGRKVINHINAEFEFSKGKISRHSDHFNF